jgi:acyl carrier protein
MSQLLTLLLINAFSQYLTAFVNKLRSQNISSILVSLYGAWDTANRTAINTESMNISELDLQYTLTEAFYMCMLQVSPTEIIAGIKKGQADKAPFTVASRPSESLFMHHEASRRINTGAALGKKGETTKTLQEQLTSCADLEAAALIVAEFFRARLASLLSIPIDDIQPDSDLTSLGADSLSASDIRNWFLKELDADVSVLKILSGSTIVQRKFNPV